jgi:hypothetical protein
MIVSENYKTFTFECTDEGWICWTVQICIVKVKSVRLSTVVMGLT